MHSSRMCTVRCSGRLGRGGVYLGDSALGVSVQGSVCLGGGGVCLGGSGWGWGCLPWGCTPPCGQIDRHL